jgi:cell division septation protein DedD
MADYRNRGGWNDDDDDNGRLSRPSGGGVGSSSIAYESGRRRSSRRRLVTLLAVLLVVGAFAGIVWNAYNQGQQSNGDGVVPLIQADNAPTKVRPDQPGGLDVPNQDKLIYDRLTPGQAPPNSVERLLPPPEAPVARPEPAPAVPQATESLLPEATPTPAPRTPVQASNNLEPPSIEPRQAAPAAPAATPAQPAKPAPSTPSVVASLPPSTAGAPGSFRVQLGAVRSQDAAHKEWARIQKANNDLLGKLGLAVSQANLGDRGTFYRIQAGPVGDQAAASDLCTKLKARNVSCIIVKQ